MCGSRCCATFSPFVWLGTALLVMFASSSEAGVVVSIPPDSLVVAAGSEFEVSVVVTEAGSSFNAISLVIGFDPDALMPLPISPLTGQVGAALLDACTSVFHDFRIGSLSDTINCALLCGGASTSGPGQIYRLRFRASPVPQVTELTFVESKFYQAGVLVTPVTSTNMVVQVAAQAAGVTDGTLTGALSVQATPNPIRGGTLLVVHGPEAGYLTLSVMDIQGRAVRQLVAGWSVGPWKAWWDGKDDSGVTVPAGVYYAVVRTSSGSAQSRIVVLR